MISIVRVSALVLASSTYFLSACQQTPHLESYEIPVTSMFLTFTPDSGEIIILNFIDNDGPGGLNPLVNSANLKSNTSYSCQLTLGSRAEDGLNKVDHFIDSTSVGATPEMHQIFFSTSETLFIDIDYTDVDLNGYPVGFSSNFETGRVGSGQLSVRIIHDPKKSALNVSSGDPSYATGTVDIEAVFQVQVTNE